MSTTTRNDEATGAIALVSPRRRAGMRSTEMERAISLLERVLDAEIVDRCPDSRCEACAGRLDRAA